MKGFRVIVNPSTDYAFSGVIVDGPQFCLRQLDSFDELPVACWEFLVMDDEGDLHTVESIYIKVIAKYYKPVDVIKF